MQRRERCTVEFRLHTADVFLELVYAAAATVLGTARVEHSRLTSLRTAVGDSGAYGRRELLDFSIVVSDY